MRDLADMIFCSDSRPKSIVNLYAGLRALQESRRWPMYCANTRSTFEKSSKVIIEVLYVCKFDLTVVCSEARALLRTEFTDSL